MSDAILELYEAAGALERIEDHLQAAGFFDTPDPRAEGRCADVYLGYGLSEPMRRNGLPGRPEPAALPLAACLVRDADEPEPPPRPFGVGTWERTWAAPDHAAAVMAARAAIAAGEVYQVNLVQHMAARFEGDPAGVAGALAPFAPLHGRLLAGPDWAIASASPELFLARRGRRIWTMPIKGTRPQGAAAALQDSPKDAAEHVMIVDLERNDLGRICEPGSVSWPELMSARSMTGVEHLVSLVEGVVREGVGWVDAMAAMFPGGSITGAPKIAALDHINALEPVGRGASMGALGTVWPNGDFELALTIRTFAIADDRIHLWVGGGVVWDSEPEAEIEESWVKARPLLDAIAAASRTPVAA
ncbi:MAG: chorismate-binding protein [Chloroflexota bacterium]|nr:chorismate-binding protein [Chloroflexota bacterium]